MLNFPQDLYGLPSRVENENQTLDNPKLPNEGTPANHGWLDFLITNKGAHALNGNMERRSEKVIKGLKDKSSNNTNIYVSKREKVKKEKASNNTHNTTIAVNVTKQKVKKEKTPTNHTGQKVKKEKPVKNKLPSSDEDTDADNSEGREIDDIRSEEEDYNPNTNSLPTLLGSPLSPASFEAILRLEAGSEREISADHTLSIQAMHQRYLRDFGTTAASIGNESAPFELKFEAEIAYFESLYDKMECKLLSETEGSKAISEGSSTAEGAASAAEGYLDIYHYSSTAASTAI